MEPKVKMMFPSLPKRCNVFNRNQTKNRQLVFSTNREFKVVKYQRTMKSLNYFIRRQAAVNPMASVFISPIRAASGKFF